MEMEAKAVAAAVTQKLIDVLNEASIAKNKSIIYQLKGFQESLEKLQRLSEEEDNLDASQRARDQLSVLYKVEDEIEKFTFRQSKQTFFFNNLNSCRKLIRKIKEIQTKHFIFPEDEAATPCSTISSSLQAVQPISETSCSLRSKRVLLTRSFSTIPHLQEHVPKRKKLTFSYSYNGEEHLQHAKQVSKFSYQEERCNSGMNDDIKILVKWPTQQRENYGSDEVLIKHYKGLSIHLKLCLLRLTLFPKYYDIPVRRFLRLWLAEGFVMRSTRHQLPEDLVQKYFEDLVDQGLIQITKLSTDNSPKHCRLVSVLHDYLSPKAQDTGLYYIHRDYKHFENAAGPFGVRRMVHHISTTADLATSASEHHEVERGKEEDATLSSSATFPSCSRDCKCTKMVASHSICSDLQKIHTHSSTFDPSLLRSYMSFNSPRKDMPAKEVGTLLGSIINSDLSLLRVLDLEGVNKPTLPDKLGQLCLLRYLGLRRTYLESLPESVGDLSHVETLDVKDTCLDSLPNSIWKLKKLRHLNLNNIRLAMAPSSSSTLLTLCGLVLDEKISVNEGLGKLRSLRELGLKFNLSQSQGVLFDWIAKLEYLQSLRLISVDDKGHASKLVFKTLVSLHKLSHLNLYGNLERLPAPNNFPPTIKVLTLSISRLNTDPMETLEQLPFLIRLRLLGDSYTGNKMFCQRGGFKKLEDLKLWMLKEFEEWDVEEDAMESLKVLEIRGCSKLNNIPCRLLQKQRSLDELVLTDMPEDFIDRIKKRKSKDTSLTINSWN